MLVTLALTCTLVASAGAAATNGAVGCWASDGTRVDRFGPNLGGRRGVCTLSGAVLQCP